MRMFVGVTDGDWFELLRSQGPIDEVNFWQPSGSSQFRALSPGEIFLFKLHSPRDFIVGGGVFSHFSLLPVTLAWSAFDLKNGARSLAEMRERVEKYRRGPKSPFGDYTIGCILLSQPFFLPEDLWIPIPQDWAPNIVRGKSYDTSSVEGRALWDEVELRLAAPLQCEEETPLQDGDRYGKPIPVRPRLGQGGFRVLVTDAYHRRGAITRERTLPVLEAAHIMPYSEGGVHDVRNGLLLRSDIHLLFDQGYVTVTPELRVEVSRRIREEFENGHDYYALHGRLIDRPERPEQVPAPALLSWHNEQLYRG